jgi:SPP1 gp7 family putative phage head morphogenesis protein
VAGFAASAEVSDFKEATDWFRNQLPITDDEIADLSATEKQRAFFITGVAQLDIVSAVHESIVQAIAEGTPLEEWRDSVAEKLTEAWGRENSAQIETVYRVATQRSYVAGRLEQLRDPEVKSLRPYLKYIAIGDGAKCPGNICPEANGTILLQDDPWWATHCPPRHFNCRCRVDSLRQETADAEGVTESPPESASPEGWGSPPDLEPLEDFTTNILQRVRENVDADLVKEFERKQARGR